MSILALKKTEVLKQKTLFLAYAKKSVFAILIRFIIQKNSLNGYQILKRSFAGFLLALVHRIQHAME